jgi:hypothetical protein
MKKIYILLLSFFTFSANAQESFFKGNNNFIIPPPPPFQPPAIVQSGLLLNLDAANSVSYPGTGNTWINLITGNSVPNFTLAGGLYGSNDGGVIRFPSNGGFASSTTGFSNLTSYTLEIWVKIAGTRGDYDPTISANTNYIPCLFSEKYDGNINMVLAFNSRGLTNAVNNSYHYTSAIYSGGWSFIEPSTNYGSDLNNWVQIIATYNGSVLKLYRNGTLMASNTINKNLRSTSPGYYIGHRWDMSDGVYGDYSVVNMYNRALSLSEISTNYNAFKLRFGL